MPLHTFGVSLTFSFILMLTCLTFYGKISQSSQRRTSICVPLKHKTTKLKKVFNKDGLVKVRGYAINSTALIIFL
jgi:hypothetical protein